jgi:hypothetical protein
MRERKLRDGDGFYGFRERLSYHIKNHENTSFRIFEHGENCG